MKEKKHYKLYKSGKVWKTVALTAATVAGVFSATTLTGNADTTNANTQGSTPANQQATVATTASDSNAVDTNKTNVQTPAASPVANDTTASDSAVKTGWQQAADKSWTYYNNDGKANTGREYSLMPTIGDTTGKSKSWYLMQDGKALSDVQEWQGSYWYFDNNNYQLSKKKDYITARWGMNYLVGDDGQIKSGVQEWAGSYWYFDPTTYLLSQKKDYVQSQWGDWYLVGNDGRIQSGVQEWMGSYWYFDPTTYLLTKKQNYVQSQWGDWYMVGNDGRIQSGLVNWMGNTYYFDPVTYLRTDNKDFTVNGIKYHADKNGVVTSTDVWVSPIAGANLNPNSFALAQRFGYDGGYRTNSFHDGLDFGSIDHPGSTVQSVHAGTVTQIGYIPGLEWYVTVDTGEYLVVYQEAFSSRSKINVTVGQKVEAGTKIGTRDTSHLHLGITRQKNFNVALGSSFSNNGTWLNPLDIIK